MTWLDVIEDEANLVLEGDEDIGEYMDKLRMAFAAGNFPE